MTRFVVISVFAFSAACGGDGDKHVTDASTHSDMAASAADMLPVEQGTVYEAAVGDGGASYGDPLSGATVCFAQHTEIPCATSASDGTFSLPFPAQPSTGELDLALTITASGHLGFTDLLREQSIGETSLSNIALLPDADVSATYFANTGFAYPTASTGFVSGAAGVASGGHFAGVTVTITPASGKIVYLGANGNFDPALTATTETGAFIIGNVTPGAFTLTFTPPNGHTCSNPANLIGSYWPSTTPNSIAGYVAAGTVTSDLNIECN